MKKLMIAFSFAMLGIAVNAGSYAWSTQVSTRDDFDAYQGGTAYLLAGGSSEASSFANTILAAGTTWATSFSTLVAGAANYATVDDIDGSMSEAKVGTWDSNNGYLAWDTSDSTYSYFMVFKDEKGFYVSDVLSGTVVDVGGTELAYAPEELHVFGDTVKTYQGEGWYTVSTEPVPEPFSGALALLGMAGIALRRKMKKAKKA